MPFYAFQLVSINIRFPRSVADDDIVTFAVFVNKVLRAKAAGVAQGLTAITATLPGSAIPMNQRDNVAPFNPYNPTSELFIAWCTGPFEIGPGDEVAVVYSGTNVSDIQALDGAKQAEVELKILDAIVPAVIGAAGLGLIGSAVTTALGLVTDPIGKLLGYTQPVPCNGLVFSDAVPFTGAELGALQFNAPGPYPGSKAITFTNPNRTGPYTDPDHPTGCGHVAETDVTLGVLQIPTISVRLYFRDVQPTNIQQGLRKLSPPRGSVRRLMRLRV
jgi:hypothetical protein